MQLRMLRSDALRRHNFRHVKAYLCGHFRVLCQVVEGCGGDFALFAPVYRLPACAVVGALPGLDLHEGQGVPLLGDEVNLPFRAGKPTLQDMPPPPPEILRRQRLSPVAHPLGLAAHSFFKKVLRWTGLGPYWRSRS